MKGFFRSSIFLRRAQYYGGSESGLIFSDSITSGRWVGVWFIRRPQIDLGMCYCVLCCSIFLIISMRHSLKEDCRRLQVSIRMTSLYFQTPNARGEGQSLSSDCITLRPSRSAFHFPVDHPYETVLYVLCARVCIPVCSSHVRLSFLRSGWIDYDCRFDQVGYEKANNACACCFLTKTAWGRRAMGTRNERREGVKRKN